MDEKPNAAEPVKKPRGRWFRLSPDRFAIGLLLAIGLLWLSERFQWFGFNHHKGWTVLIAVAAVGVAAIVVVLWWIAGLILGWRFQFRIRSVLAFCLAASIAASWLAVERGRARRQAEAVEWINGISGLASYDWECDADGMSIDNLPNSAPPQPPGPIWLRTMLGVDFLSSVNRVFLYDTPVTDNGLEQLKELSQLRSLNLNSTKANDAELEHLKGLTQLQTLWLTGTDITDVGVKYLSGLVQLQSLQLACTKITDGGLSRIHELTQLQALDLSQTAITDAGLERLTSLTQLEYLGLEDTHVTDDGLKYLSGLNRLRRLNLTGTKITDAGLEQLKRFSRLERLEFSGTEITDAGMTILRQALPDCELCH